MDTANKIKITKLLKEGMTVNALYFAADIAVADKIDVVTRTFAESLTEAIKEEREKNIHMEQRFNKALDNQAKTFNKAFDDQAKTFNKALDDQASVAQVLADTNDKAFAKVETEIKTLIDLNTKANARELKNLLSGFKKPEDGNCDILWVL